MSVEPGNTKRCANWNMKEDEQLARSWTHISEDPIRANSMKREEFWARATADYNLYAPSGEREAKSLINRWAHLQKTTLKFTAIYHWIESNPPSGTSPTDWLRFVKESYSDETGKRFAYESAWMILKDVVKWQVMAAPKKVPVNPSSPLDSMLSSTAQSAAPSASQQDNTREIRPIGNRAAKRQLDQSIFLKKKLKILEMSAAATKQRVEEFKQANNLQTQLVDAELRTHRMDVMLKDPAQCPDDFARMYLLKEKQKILDDMEARETARQNTLNQTPPPVQTSSSTIQPQSSTPANQADDDNSSEFNDNHQRTQEQSEELEDGDLDEYEDEESADGIGAPVSPGPSRSEPGSEDEEAYIDPTLGDY